MLTQKQIDNLVWRDNKACYTLIGHRLPCSTVIAENERNPLNDRYCNKPAFIHRIEWVLPSTVWLIPICPDCLRALPSIGQYIELSVARVKRIYPSNVWLIEFGKEQTK